MIHFSNCKINLGLNIVEKRTDGFHDIESVMYPVNGLCDVIEIFKNDSDNVNFFSTGIVVDCAPAKNLCVKAYRLIADRYDIEGVDIHLHKVVPFGAGLGGGSSDAVGVLHLLNSLFNLDLSVDILKDLAAELGSDTIFFVENRPSLVTGRGEVITPIDFSLSGIYLVIVKPEVFVSTAQAYKGVIPKRPKTPILDVLQKNISEWKVFLKNDFEDSIFENNLAIRDIKDILYNSGAIYASMSGSGSAVFGLFESKPDMKFLPSGVFFHMEMIP